MCFLRVFLWSREVPENWVFVQGLEQPLMCCLTSWGFVLLSFSTVLLSCKLCISLAAEKKRILSTSLALQWTTLFIKKSRKAKKKKLTKKNKALLNKNEISGLLAITGHGLLCQSWDVTNLTFLLTMQPPDSCQAGKSQIDESTMSKRANERAFISKMKPKM